MMVLPHRLLLKMRKDIALEDLVSLKSPVPLGLLEVEICEARDLQPAEKGFLGQSSCDPFVEVSVGTFKIRSSTEGDTLCPKWKDGKEYLFIFSLGQRIRIEVFQDNVLQDDNLLGSIPGHTAHSLCQQLERMPEGGWLPIQSATSGDKGEKAGELRLKARFLKTSDLARWEMQQPSSGTLLGTAAGRLPEGEPVPYLVTVKLLGLEGESTKLLNDVRCDLEFVPDSDAPGEDDAAGEDIASRAFRRGLGWVKGATGRGWGDREKGVPNKARSVKAKPWADVVTKMLGNSQLSPSVVRAIEQLRHREKWDLDRIAAMFGIEEAAVKRAADVRANFELVWHQAFHFVHSAEEPFSGSLRIHLHSPPSLFAKGDRGTERVHSKHFANEVTGGRSNTIIETRRRQISKPLGATLPTNPFQGKKTVIQTHKDVRQERT